MSAEAVLGMLHRAAPSSQDLARGFRFLAECHTCWCKVSITYPNTSSWSSILRGTAAAPGLATVPEGSFQRVLAGDSLDELEPSVFPASVNPTSFPGWHQPSSSQLLPFEFRGLCMERCSGDRQHSPPSAESWSLPCQRRVRQHGQWWQHGVTCQAGGFVLLSFPVYETFTLCTEWRGGQAG